MRLTIGIDRIAGPQVAAAQHVFTPLARADGVTDDTAAIQAAVDAAAAYAAVHGSATVVINPGVYMVQDAGGDDPVTSTTGVIWIGPTVKDVTIIGWGATLKIGPNGVRTDNDGDNNAVIRCFGTRIRIYGLTVDGNGAASGGTATTGEANVPFEINGTDNLCAYCTAKNGSKHATNVLTQGSNDFVTISGSRIKFHYCHSEDAEFNGFKCAGTIDRVEFVGCTATDFKGNGIRVQGSVETVIILAPVFTSSICDGRCGITLDSNSGDSATAQRTNYALIDGADIFVDCVSSSCYGMKVGATKHCVIANSSLRCGNTSNGNGSLRPEDSTRKLVVKNTYLNAVRFNPVANSGSTVYGGVPSAHEDNGSGFVRFTVASGHGLVRGKSLFVKGSSIPQYNREHIITGIEAQTGSATKIDTDIPFTAGTLDSAGTLWAHSACDEVYFEDVTIESTLSTGGTFIVEDAYARILSLERVKFNRMGVAFTVKMAFMEWEGANNDKGLDLFRLVDCEFRGNCNKVMRGIYVTNHTVNLLRSGRTIGYGNSIHNVDATVAINEVIDTRDHTAGNEVVAYANRATLFNTQGENRNYFGAAAIPSGTDVTFAVGDKVRHTDPTAGQSPGWVCTTAGAVGTWQTEAALA